MDSNIIRLRYTGTCVKCESTLQANTQAHWDRENKAVTCLSCVGSPLAEAMPVKYPNKVATQTPDELTKPFCGNPGASAAHEYQRRHDNRQARLDQRFGAFAGIVKFLVDDPQSTKAWAKGSSGERELAESLSRRIGDRAVLLHDRKVPKSSANIDHLAIASSGIWVIDAKKYQGKLSRVDKGGWRTIDYHVLVGGRDQTKLVPSMHKQGSIVRHALGDSDIEIHLALCFIGAEWDFFLKPFKIDGVWIIYPKMLAELIAAPGTLSSDEVLQVANRVALALPPK